MQTAYFRQLPEEEQCAISFRVASERYRIDKVFNFSRNVTECVDASLERMRANIEKEVKKRGVGKKKKAKVAGPAEEQQGEALPDVRVRFFDVEKNEDVRGVAIAELLSKVREEREILLKVLDDDFRIDLNSPTVLAVSLPQSILAGFYVYPAKLETVFTDKERSEFRWFRGKMPKSNNAQQIEWIPAGSGYSYMAKPEDVGHHLKFSCVPKNELKAGPLTEVISSTEVQAGPGQCPFEVRHLFTQNKLTNEYQFRVVTYNILADLYADSDYSRTELFGYCPNYALHIDYRKQLFIKEILGYNADIVCLQEVDGKVYDLDLLPVFQVKNFDGHYKAKGKSGEGLATFFECNRFEVLDRQGITFGENLETLEPFQGLWNQIKANEKLASRIRDRSTAIQATLLRSRQNPTKHVLVANTHFYFHPDADHIRLLQGGFSMLYVRDLYERYEKQYGLDRSHFAIVFCGDFNSTPECGMFRLMTERFVGDEMADWRSNEEEAVRGVTLAQPFPFQSACGTPKYTNFTVGFRACIDYIYYQCDALRVNDVVPQPSEEELAAYDAIPSPVFPSDHVAQVASLEWNHKSG
uniref:2',5'-phosphodiesterase 12 n=1 Tax=Culex tarsalis TaxID=7177 RepID=A0A1Q3F6I5_CULTA